MRSVKHNQPETFRKAVLYQNSEKEIIFGLKNILKFQ
jgi:hypothetical protein